MLKRLKIKFVIVIMTIVTILFGAIFGLVMHLTKQNMERESIQMMRTHALRPQQSVPFRKPDDIPNNIRLPFFTVNISGNGEIRSFGGDYYDLSDEKMLAELVDIVYESSEPIGMLPEYDLRFLKADTDTITTIVFADVSSEKAILRGLMQTSLIIGLIGYTVFFVISILLAEWMTKPVEKTWNEQKQFIADASHELKTPLTVIMTNAEMLTDKNYAESDRNNFTKNILSTSKRMRGLVESLLELARLDNNKSSVRFELIDYSKLINDCILPFEPLFYEKGMEFSAHIDDNIKVEGDKDKLRQVMTILLDNALKYYDSANSIDILLKRQTSHCILKISGRGTPLSKADCKNIFKRFYRIDQSRTDCHSYGLGLSIAESIINEHHGKIWAESVNGYNTFYALLATG